MSRRAHIGDGCPYAELESTNASRRALLQRLIGLTLGAPTAAGLLAACGDADSPTTDDPMGEGMPEWMMGSGSMDADMMRDMRVIRDLLADHDEIQRRVHDIPGGIQTLTTSSDERIAERIQTHVWQMKQRVEDGEPIRQMDPLFREIFNHHTAIRMKIHNTDHGVEVAETSDDPQVALLIRQHARRAVSEFVADGMSRAMQSTPLPSGYRPEGKR